jgi:hypothetical protein
MQTTTTTSTAAHQMRFVIAATALSFTCGIPSNSENRATEIVAISIALQPTMNPTLSAARFEIVAGRPEA